MLINYESLKKKYFNLFEGNVEYFNFIITDVLFAYSEISKIFDNSKINRVLEVGCGTGILLKELKDNYKDIEFVGLDPNQSGFHNYEKISKKVLNLDDSINIIKSSIENFNNEKKFDLIFSFNVFEHVDNQEQYIINTVDLLTEGGKNIIFAPNYDFPYEPHFIIPIIFNKKITEKIFKKRIENYEIKTQESGLWDALQITGKKKLCSFLNKKNFNYRFDDEIINKMLDRALNDNFFRKRQGLAGKLAVVGRKIYLDKIIFSFFRIPFPYFKLIITK